jgi:hypothetical protein
VTFTRGAARARSPRAELAVEAELTGAGPRVGGACPSVVLAGLLDVAQEPPQRRIGVEQDAYDPPATSVKTSHF